MLQPQMYLLSMVQEKKIKFVYMKMYYMKPFTTNILQAKVWSALISKKECTLKLLHIFGQEHKEMYIGDC